MQLMSSLLIPLSFILYTNLSHICHGPFAGSVVPQLIASDIAAGFSNFLIHNICLPFIFRGFVEKPLTVRFSREKSINIYIVSHFLSFFFLSQGWKLVMNFKKSNMLMSSSRAIKPTRIMRGILFVSLFVCFFM